MRRKQEGITLIGFIIVLIVFMIFGWFAMKVIPMYTEYSDVVKGLEGAIKEPGIATMDEKSIRDHISRHFEIGYVSSIDYKDVKLKRDENGLTMSVDYEVRKPLVYNLFLVGHFEKTVSNVPGKGD